MTGMLVATGAAPGGFEQHGNGTFVLRGLTAGESVLVTIGPPPADGFVLKVQPGDPSEFHYFGQRSQRSPVEPRLHFH